MKRRGEEKYVCSDGRTLAEVRAAEEARLDEIAAAVSRGSLTRLERELVDALLLAREALKAALEGISDLKASEYSGVIGLRLTLRAALRPATAAIQRAVGLVPDTRPAAEGWAAPAPAPGAPGGGPPDSP